MRRFGPTLIVFALTAVGAQAQESPAPAEPSGAPALDEPSTEPAPAAEPEEPAPIVTTDDQGIPTIIVLGDAVASRRLEVERNLERLGYDKAIRKDGKTVYRPAVPWKTTVEVHDEGFVILKRSPVRFAPRDQLPGLWGSWLPCVVFPPFCLAVGGQLVSPAKLGHSKSEVAYGVNDSVNAWRDAVVARAMTVRIEEEVPALLDAIWLQGTGLDGRELPTAADRRAELLGFWASRADTPEGAAVRDAVATYLLLEVQTSATPLTADEIATAEKAAGVPLEAAGARVDGAVPAPAPPLDAGGEAP